MLTHMIELTAQVEAAPRSKDPNSEYMRVLKQRSDYEDLIVIPCFEPLRKYLAHRPEATLIRSALEYSVSQKSSVSSANSAVLAEIFADHPEETEREWSELSPPDQRFICEQILGRLYPGQVPIHIREEERTALQARARRMQGSIRSEAAE